MAVQARALTGSPPADQAVTPAGKQRNYYGFSVREVAASAAVSVFNIRDGESGKILDTCEVAADGNQWRFYPGGISAPKGVYFDIVSGEITGVVFTD